jgi:uncharacterized protein involved in outer membrane biogenesis
MAILKWIGIVFVSFLLLFVLLLALMDWNWVRGYAARKLSDMIGRTLTIEGDLDIAWSWRPRIHAERIRLENAPWSREPFMVKLAALDFRIDLGALITGRVVLPEITLRQPRVLLERSSEGEPNWRFQADPVAETAGDAVVPEERTELPVIGQLQIEDGRVVYRDLSTQTDITATLATIQGEGGGEETVEVQAQGTLQGQPLALHLNAGALVELREAGEPYPLTLEVKAGDTTAQVKGTLMQPLQLAGLDLAVTVQGSGSKMLAAFTGTPLSTLPPYRLQARLSRQSDTWQLSEMQGSLGQSDVAGEATVAVGNTRPSIQASVKSDTLDVEQLLTVLTPTQTQASPQHTQTPPEEEAPLAVEPLRALDADVTFQAAKVITPQVTVEDLAVHVTLEAGRLHIEPLRFDVGGGTLTSHLTLDASTPLLQGSLQAQVEHIDLGQVRGGQEADVANGGTLDGTVKLSLAPSRDEPSPLTLASLLQRLQVGANDLSYRDPATGTDIKATLRTEPSDKGSALKLEGKGQYQHQTVSFTAEAADLARLTDPDTPYAVNAEVMMNETRVHLKTTLDEPLTLEGLNMDVSLRGASTADLAPLLGTSLPDLSPFQINGHIKRVGDTWKLDDFTSIVAGSDLSGQIAVDTGGKRPLIRIDLVAEKLDIQQLLDHLDRRAAEATAPSDKTAATATTLNVQPLRAVDAVINLRAEHIIAPHLSLEHVILHTELYDGQLLVKPLTLELQGGKIVADLDLNASEMPLHGTLHATLQGLDLDRILQPFALTDQQLGMMSGELNLRATSADASRAGADVMLPWLGRFAIEDSHLSYTDPAHDIDIDTKMSTVGPASGDQEVRIESQGRYRGEGFELHFRGDSLLDLREPEEPYALDITVGMAQTQARLAGQLIHPLKLKGVDMHLTVEGPDPERLSPLLGFPLPSLPPYQVKGDLSRQGDTWQLLNFAGRVGDSDLAGDIRVDTGRERLFVEADLTSRKVDFDDLGPLVGAAPDTGAGETTSPGQQQEAKQEEASASVLPKDPIDFEHLRRLDAKITLQGKRIEAKLPLDDLALKLNLDNGRLTMTPLDFGVAGGNIRSRIDLDVTARPVKGNIETEVRRVRLNEILRRFEIADESVGLVGGRAKFWVQGAAVAEMLASADGGLLLLMTGGKLDDLLVELAGLDVGEALAALIGKQKGVEINCAFVDLPTTHGVMHLDTLVVDTDDTVFLGAGSIDFTQEQLDLTIDPKPKDLSVFSARAPLHIKGRFEAPTFTPESSAILRGATSLALLPAAPVAALLSLLQDENDEENPHCSGLVDAINKAR